MYKGIVVITLRKTKDTRHNFAVPQQVPTPSPFHMWDVCPFSLYYVLLYYMEIQDYAPTSRLFSLELLLFVLCFCLNQLGSKTYYKLS